VFTRNSTEAINLVALSWGRNNLKPDDEILLTEMEHHSNLIPWQLVAQATGAKLRFIPVDVAEGTLDLSHVDTLLTKKTRLVSVTQMSNVLGTINPVKELVKKAHAVGALFLVDGAQSVPHMPVSVTDLDCDFLAFSAHKMLGPTGIGVLWGRRSLMEKMEPFLGGGDMIREVWPDRATWNDLPYKFEAGTPNIADAVAFGAALDFISGIGFDAIRAHERELTGYAISSLKREFPDIALYGPQNLEGRGGVVSFNLKGIHPHDVGTIVDSEGVAIRAGHHCAQILMKKLNVSATARASFYLYNTLADVDVLVTALKNAERMFGAALPRA
jgi:cysteine desulfurase/selenocysteine lyase